MFYFKEHGPLLSGEVTGQDVPQPDDDTVAAVKTSIVDGVFPGERRLRFSFIAEKTSCGTS